MKQYWVVLRTATLTQHNENGAQCARHHSKGKDEEGDCKKRMRRCGDALCLRKANRQHGRKQDKMCLNRAELSTEDLSELTLSFYLTNEWKQRFCKKEGWAEWCCTGAKKQTHATHLFRLKGGDGHICNHSARRLLLSNTWGELCVQQCLVPQPFGLSELMQYKFYLANGSSGTTWKKIPLCCPVCRSFCTWLGSELLTYVSASKYLFHSFARARKENYKATIPKIELPFCEHNISTAACWLDHKYFGKVKVLQKDRPFIFSLSLPWRQAKKSQNDAVGLVHFQSPVP